VGGSPYLLTVSRYYLETVLEMWIVSSPAVPCPGPFTIGASMSMRARRVSSLVAALVCVALPLTSCGNKDKTITVLAASSLTGTFTTLATQFEKDHPGVHVKLAFDSSATLAQQATAGAPADVLATADTATMASAKAALAQSPKNFATNVMVLATPSANPAGISRFSDLNSSKVKYVVCVASAPCGTVAAALLKQDGITASPVSTEIDVKSVLARLTEGEADAGIVYTTDAVAAGDQVRTISIPGSAQQRTTYPIAPLTQSKQSTLADEFVELVLSSAGQRVLQDAGFGQP
jgi:molybdate transport system substrate-binding protein